MPMFDDPKKELNRLQEELLAEEDSSWEDELAGLDSLLADYEEDRTLPVKEAYRDVKDLHRMSDALLDEDDEEYEEDEDLYRDEVKKAKKQKQNQKGVGGLIAVAVVESLAIIGLLVWWLVWLR